MEKELLFALVCILLNIPFGYLRSRHPKLSLWWFVYIHLPVPFIIACRIYLNLNSYFIPIFIAMAVLGQYIGAVIYRNKHKSKTFK